MLRVTAPPLARGVHVAAMSTAGLALLALALRWSLAAALLLVASALLAPAALGLALAGRGALRRGALVAAGVLCVLGGLVAFAAAFSGKVPLAWRAGAALVGAVDAWGAVAAVRVWRG